jgi:uncharacterized protein (DUF58 family)
MRRVWKKLSAAMEGGVRQRVTKAGWAYTLAVIVLGVAAVGTANNLLFLIVAAMLSALLVSGFISRLSLAGLELDLSLPGHISARQPVAGRICLRNHKRWAPSFSILLEGMPGSSFSSAVYFPAIPSGAKLEETVEVTFKRRGIYREDSFVFSTRFPFGFTERRAQVILRRDVLVYPCLAARPDFDETLREIRGEIEAHYRGRGHDFYRIRPYEPFESARHVDWKASAHTGELQVREFEREQDNLLEVFFDIDAPRDKAAWFEQTVERCAYIAWWAMERGARLRFRTQDFDRYLPQECDVYHILKYLALVEPSGRKIPPPDDENSFQVVFTANARKMRAAGWTRARYYEAGALEGPTGGLETRSTRPS